MIHKHITISSLFVLLIFFNSETSTAQTTYFGEFNLTAQGSTQKELPFWMYSNQRGRISPETNLLGLLTAKMEHELRGESILEIGAGGVVHDGFSKKIALDEAYLQFRNDHFYVTGGIKQKEKLYNGLSATNENILWSLNARPLPGLEIGTTKPIFVLPGIGFEGRWGEYILEEDRHVPWARVHHKKFSLVLQPAEDWEIKAGIQHFAQWGGTSPEWGPQPTGISDYIKVFLGREGGENAISADQQNVLGNHLGSYEIEIIKNFESKTFKFIYNSLFDDGSGSRMDNFPDGRYGFLYQKDDIFSIFSGFFYEFYYMRDHSGTGPHPYDDYLNNWPTYNSGWSYYKMGIAAPLIWYSKQLEQTINNKFVAHHFGVEGNFGHFYNPLPYKLLATYSHNEGTFRRPITPAGENIDLYSIFFTSRFYNANFDHDLPRLTLDFLFAADFHNLLDPNFGAGISLKYVIL